MTGHKNNSRGTRVLVVDYGGVLGNHHQDPAERTLASFLQVDRESCRRLLSEKSAQGAAFREDGISETEFWDRVFDLAGGSVKKRPANAVLSRLWSETYELNLDILGVLRAVRQTTPVGVLTNIDRARSAYLVGVVGILAEVDIYLPSYQFHAIKPKVEFWEGAAAVLRDKFGEDVRVVYVDDREEHVRTCEAVGWEGIAYRSVDELRLGLRHREFL